MALIDRLREIKSRSINIEAPPQERPSAPTQTVPAKTGTSLIDRIRLIKSKSISPTVVTPEKDVSIPIKAQEHRPLPQLRAPTRLESIRTELPKLGLSFQKGIFEGLPFVSPENFLGVDLFTDQEEKLMTNAGGMGKVVELAGFATSFTGTSKAIAAPLEFLSSKILANPATRKLALQSMRLATRKGREAIKFGTEFGLFQATKPAEDLKERLGKATMAFAGGATASLAMQYAAPVISKAVTDTFGPPLNQASQLLQRQFLEPIERKIRLSKVMKLRILRERFRQNVEDEVNKSFSDFFPTREPLSVQKITDVADLKEPILIKATEVRLGYSSGGYRKIYANLLTASLDILRKMGASGKLLADHMEQVTFMLERESGVITADFKILLNAAKKSIKGKKIKLDDAVISSLESGTKASTKEIQHLVDYMRAINKAISEDAVNLKILVRDTLGNKVPFEPIGGNTGNYFPHNFNINDLVKILKSKAGDEKKLAILKSIVETGQAKNLGEAEELLNKFIASKVERFSGNLQHARELDLPGWNRDLGEWIATTESSIKRLLEQRAYGEGDLKAIQLIENIGREGGDIGLAKRVFERATGRQPFDIDTEKILSNLRSIQTWTLLATAQVTQLSQLSSTLSKGYLRTLIGLAKILLNPKMQTEIARRSGSILRSYDEFINSGEALHSGTFISVTGIRSFDTGMRILSNTVSRDWFKDMMTQLIRNPNLTGLRRELGKIEVINLDAIIRRGFITEEELRNASKWITDLSQVRVQPEKLPPSWNTSWGKLITQFKSFSFGSIKFWNYLIDEASNGNTAPLIRFIPANILVGEGIANVKALIKGKERNPDVINRLIEDLSYGYGFGLLGDAIRAAQFGQKGVLSFLVGPTFSSIAEVTGSVTQPRQLAKVLTRRIPFVGPLISERAFPSGRTRGTRSRSRRR